MKETLRALVDQVLVGIVPCRFSEGSDEAISKSFFADTLEEAVFMGRIQRNNVANSVLSLKVAMASLKKSQKCMVEVRLSIRNHVEELIERKGIRSKEAIREVAMERGMSRSAMSIKRIHVE